MLAIRNKNDEITDLLTQLYYGFNKKYLPAYSDLRKATVLVLNKVKQGNHPEAWANKLAMYLEARITKNNILINDHQAALIHQLNLLCIHTHLNYVYLSPIDSLSQFEN